MHWDRAVSGIQELRALPRKPPGIDFITPAISATLAAESIYNDNASHVTFHGSCSDYAENCGLKAALSRNFTLVSRTGRQGSTYSRLTRLQHSADVECSNEIINDLLYSQLGSRHSIFVNEIARIVGELHDNIVSHANGCGFSCAQVYRERLEFSVADSGCGMLANVQEKEPSITTDRDAIQWCLERGHTTAVSPLTDWPQRLPDDALYNPYPSSVETISSDNHHVGEGLWKLTELISHANGGLAIWSGTCVSVLENGKWRHLLDQEKWHGLMIELEIDANNFNQILKDTEATEKLAKRLGL